MTDVLERIDQLVAEEKCPHCDREWHELPLTQRVARMFESGHLDPHYFAQEDRTPIVCDGASQYGARRPDPPPISLDGRGIWGTFDSGGWLPTGTILEWPKSPVETVISYTIKYATDALCAMVGLKGWELPEFTFNTWLPGDEEPECEPVPDLEVEFGPQNWLPSTEPVHTPQGVVASVRWKWGEFTAPETHAPKSPGIDFAGLAEQVSIEPKYPTGKKVTK